MDLCEFEASLVFKNKFEDRLLSYRGTLSQKNKAKQKPKTTTKTQPSNRLWEHTHAFLCHDIRMLCGVSESMKSGVFLS